LEIKYKAIYILEFETKFGVCLQFFHTIKEYEMNITTESKENFSHVWQDIVFVSVGTKIIMQRRYESVKKILALTTMAIINE
jgi:hypothetical protein